MVLINEVLIRFLQFFSVQVDNLEVSLTMSQPQDTAIFTWKEHFVFGDGTTIDTVEATTMKYDMEEFRPIFLYLVQDLEVEASLWAKFGGNIRKRNLVQTMWRGKRLGTVSSSFKLLGVPLNFIWHLHT